MPLAPPPNTGTFQQQATGLANGAITDEQRGTAQSIADQTARFGPAMGAVKDALTNQSNQNYAGQQGNASRQISLAAQQQGVTGQEINTQQAGAEEEAARQRSLDNFLTQLSLSRRNAQIAELQRNGQQMQQAAIVGGVLKLVGGVVGGIEGGAGGASAGSALGGAAGDAYSGATTTG